jgi:hypothetical protein
VTARQVEEYIDQKSGINFDKVFQEYLTTTMVPTLEYKIDGATLSYHWVNVVPGFDMPMRVKWCIGSDCNSGNWEQGKGNGEKGEGGKEKEQANPVRIPIGQLSHQPRIGRRSRCRFRILPILRLIRISMSR